MTGKKLILASKSARRREILENLGIEFEIAVQDANETLPSEIKDTSKIVCGLACRKFYAVSDIVSPESIVIAADTVVDYNGEVYGKPDDVEHARFMLGNLSGSTHFVYTGLAVGNKEKLTVEYVKTAVTFRKLTNGEIDHYLKIQCVTDKAGAYGIQDFAGLFVEKIDGDYYNIVGLPIARLAVILARDFDCELYSFSK